MKGTTGAQKGGTKEPLGMKGRKSTLPGTGVKNVTGSNQVKGGSTSRYTSKKK
jgi:hypothetical protein